MSLRHPVHTTAYLVFDRNIVLVQMHLSTGWCAFAVHSPLVKCTPQRIYQYGVATISRLLQMMGLFCKRALYKR